MNNKDDMGSTNNMQENKNGFSYTYSAKDMEEIKAIKEKYTSGHSEESTLERMRRLDASVGKRAMIISVIIGIAGTLLLGLGMSLFMSELGAGLGILAFVIGIVLGGIGISAVALAYPLYSLLAARERKRIAPEILRLAEALEKN